MKFLHWQFYILFGVMSFIPSITFSQEIDFGSYAQYSVSVTPLSPAQDLDFGIIVQNEGLKSIPVNDAKIMIIEGVKYLDVIVDITADDYLLLNGDISCQSDVNCRLPFTLQAAYANNGSDNTNQARQMTVSANVASAQFPIFDRATRPPGPPPTPTHEGYNPALHNESAYLYIYGAINVGDVAAGSYTANVTISISYD